MKIAVCEDSNAYRNFVSNRIKRICTRKGLQVEVDSFSSGQETLSHMLETSYDILFSDIEMPEMNGFELAEKATMLSKAIVIVFFTEYQHLVFESFQYHPVWFVRKSSIDVDLDLAITEVIKQNEYVDKLVTISYRNLDHEYNSETFRLSDVDYVECNGHTISFHVGKSVKSTSGNLTSYEKEYEKHGFVRTHSKYLVNSRKIFSLEKNRVVLLSNEGVPLSRHRIREVEKAMIQFGGKR